MVFIPFTSCDNDFSYDLEGNIIDVDSLYASWYTEGTFGIGTNIKVYLNPTRKVGTSSFNFHLVDKDGNNPLGQVDLSQIRIYEVVNGKEVMQFKYKINAKSILKNKPHQVHYN